MNKAFLFLSVVCLLFALAACTKETEPMIGYCTPPTLSKSTLYFSKQGGIDSLTTSYRIWLDFNSFNEVEECEKTYDERNSIVEAECIWFNVTRIDRDSKSFLFALVKENGSGKERSSNIYLRAGNCDAVFTITQAAE